MYCLSVIIPNYAKNFKQCIKSVLNQSLKNIEIICLFDEKNYSIINDFDKSNNKIKWISSEKNLDIVCGEYVLIVRDIISSQTCEFLYNEIKSQELNVLYIPNYDFINGNDSQLEDMPITPINFTPLYKNNVFKENLNNNFLDNKNIGYCNWILYPENNLNLEFIEKIINKTSKFNYNKLFSVLINYLSMLPINNRQQLYEVIKKHFKNIYLNTENNIIYDHISKNIFYLDFLTELNLQLAEYDIYEGSKDNTHYKISVIIPIFNNETLIHRTLMSIENQSFDFRNIEVLMVNDASTDDTLKVINNYADAYPNFKAIHIKNRTGSAGTPRNIGLKLASADYVIFIDHDDFFEIDALEKLYSTAIENKCDFVYGTYVLIDCDKPIKFSYPNEIHGFFKNLKDNERSIITPPSIWTKLFKREFILKNNILFPPILGEDIIFISKALKNANGIYYLWDDLICYYNLNENSFTSNLSYEYFVEGFTSEEYLFNLYSSWNHEEYYALRGQGTLDFYLNRFISSNLSEYEIEKIFHLLYGFCYRLHTLNIFPKQSKNSTTFNIILKKDVRSLIKFKNYKPNKIERIFNIILSKINRHDFW